MREYAIEREWERERMGEREYVTEREWEREESFRWGHRQGSLSLKVSDRELDNEKKDVKVQIEKGR